MTAEKHSTVAVREVSPSNIIPGENMSGPFATNSILGSGIITGELGEGGMAVVYEIWNEQLGVKRAVKVLKPDFAGSNRARFNTEIKLTAQLDHPNIITIHSVGEWKGLPYIEMEKVDGWSLEQVIEQRGALPSKVAAAIALIVARSLKYTHSLEYTIDGQERIGLLHRDLKPANILLSRRGKVRLTDFGIATPVNVSMHTKDGNVVGSLQYIAPEQLADDESVDSRADIFSFGCVLYEMLTGFKTFPDKNFTRLIPKRLANSYDPLQSYRISLPVKVKKLVRKCLERDSAKRPATMGEVCAELGRIYQMLTPESPEQVVRDFVSNGVGEVNFISMKRRRPGRRFFAYAAGFAVTGLLVSALISKIPNINKLINLKGHTSQASFFPFFNGLKEKSEQKLDMDPEVLASMIDSLKDAYRTNDLLTVMKEEDDRNNFTNVLAFSTQLSSRKKTSLLGVLLTTRALEGTNQLGLNHFRENHINDAEFLLIKARYLYDNDHFNEALTALDALYRAPAYLLSKKMLKREALVQKARTLTALAKERKENEAETLQALQTWRDVKMAFRNWSTHPVHKEAARNSYALRNL